MYISSHSVMLNKGCPLLKILTPPANSRHIASGLYVGAYFSVIQHICEIFSETKTQIFIVLITILTRVASCATFTSYLLFVSVI